MFLSEINETCICRGNHSKVLGAGFVLFGRGQGWDTIFFFFFLVNTVDQLSTYFWEGTKKAIIAGFGQRR